MTTDTVCGRTAAQSWFDSLQRYRTLGGWGIESWLRRCHGPRGIYRTTTSMLSKPHLQYPYPNSSTVYFNSTVCHRSSYGIHGIRYPKVSILIILKWSYWRSLTNSGSLPKFFIVSDQSVVDMCLIIERAVDYHRAPMIWPDQCDHRNDRSIDRVVSKFWYFGFWSVQSLKKVQNLSPIRV